MSDAAPRRSLWVSGASSLATGVLSIGLGLISSVLIARGLGPGGRGGFDLMLTTANLLATLVGLALPAGVTYIVARGGASLPLLGRQLVGVIALQTLAAWAALLLAIRLGLGAALLPPGEQQRMIVLATALVLLTQLTVCCRAALVGSQAIVRSNAIDLQIRIIFIVTVVALLLGARASAIHLGGGELIMAQVAAMATGVLLLLGALRPIAVASAGGDDRLRQLLRYVPPIALANLAQFLSYRIDVFFVSAFRDVSQVGYYTLATSLTQLIWLVPSAAAQVLLPSVAADADSAAAQRRTARVTRLVLWGGGGIGLALMLVAQWLIPLVYGAAFAPSVAPLRLLLPGIACYGVANVLNAYMAGSGNQRHTMTMAIVGLATIVALDLLLIPPYGIEGAAIASSIAYTIIAAGLCLIFTRHSGIGLRALLIPNYDDLSLVGAAWRRISARKR